MADQVKQIALIARSLAASLDSGALVSSENIAATENGISLLGLKNQALLAYLNNLVLVAAAQIQQAQGLDSSKIFESARQGSVTQRVTLEKGVKGLESKISYQVDKALRAYRKTLEQAKDEQQDEDDENSDSDDPTQYRPNVGGLSASRDDDESEEEGTKKKYTAPKISATTPFARQRKPRRKDFTMDEYIRESADAPMAEPSIGSTIMDHGMGGERTERDRRKQKEIDDYEEANYTRIQSTSSKQARKDAQQRQRDASSRNLFGEDWGFLGGDNDNSGNKRKKFNGSGNKKRRKH